MKKRLIRVFTVGITLVFVIIRVSFAQNAFKVYINEIRAADYGTDDSCFVELIGPSTTNITNFKIYHYNQTSTHQWTITISSFTIPNDGITDSDGNNVGFFILVQDASVNNNDQVSSTFNPQNGPADFLVLKDNDGNILDAVAWGGIPSNIGTVGLTTSGSTSADNYLHVTVDDQENDNSLQAPDNVLGDNGSGWTYASATSGQINNGQTSGDISLPVTLTSFTATPGNAKVTLNWITESEVENLGFNIYRSLYSDEQFTIINDQLIPGHGNTSSRHEYQHIDRNVINGIEYWYQLEDVSYTGETEKHDIVSTTPKGREELGMVPDDFQLFPCYPNPFNPATNIKFNIPENTHVMLKIIDLRGNLVNVLVDKEQSCGYYEFIWDGRNIHNCLVGNGVYFYQLTTNKGFKSTGKMVFLR
ncbi:MAG: T9SS type A sorting domain-containing protein [Candidatus Marinimicrobia bacterium]|nr:T9SS type A sorting domain-containing protein [Candidatus Neomarinimicrobiota bacterium]